MKIFGSVLGAILVAAGIIWFAVWVYQARQQVESRRERVRELTSDSEMTQAEPEWGEQRRRNPQFDPNAEKLMARLHEIREARDAGRPIPPSPWNEHTEDTPATRATKPSATATPIVTITQPISIAVPHGSVGVAAGTKLPFVSRAGDKFAFVTTTARTTTFLSRRLI